MCAAMQEEEPAVLCAARLIPSPLRSGFLNGSRAKIKLHDACS